MVEKATVLVVGQDDRGMGPNVAGHDGANDVFDPCLTGLRNGGRVLIRFRFDRSKESGIHPNDGCERTSVEIDEKLIDAANGDFVGSIV